MDKRIELYKELCTKQNAEQLGWAYETILYARQTTLNIIDRETKAIVFLGNCNVHKYEALPSDWFITVSSGIEFTIYATTLVKVKHMANDRLVIELSNLTDSYEVHIHVYN